MSSEECVMLCMCICSMCRNMYMRERMDGLGCVCDCILIYYYLICNYSLYMQSISLNFI